MNERSRIATGLTIGMDIGDKFTELCIIDREGEVVRAFRARTTEVGIQQAFAPYMILSWRP